MNKPSILIIEPDATLRQTIADKMLRPQGFDPVSAQSPEEGLGITLQTTPDLLLLHLSIPQVEQILSRLSNFGRKIPTILVVEQSTIQVGVKLLRLGVVDYVTWPPMVDDLLRVINSTLENQSHRMNGGKHVNFEFADMASHLMRNPLSVIQTSVRCLQTLELEPDDRDNLQEKIWQQSQRLTNFTNELLNILRLETEGANVYTAPISLLPLVERVLTFVRHENPDLSFRLQPVIVPLPPVAADSVKIEMILLNLLLGAGRRCHPVGGTITIALVPDDSEVTITISDNGRPIPIGPAEDIFQPFYAPDRSQTNIPSTYQLGLYTTKRWVELQRGRIWADSVAGEGSRFSFSLPIWEC